MCGSNNDGVKRSKLAKAASGINLKRLKMETKKYLWRKRRISQLASSLAAGWLSAAA